MQVASGFPIADLAVIVEMVSRILGTCRGQRPSPDESRATWDSWAQGTRSQKAFQNTFSESFPTATFWEDPSQPKGEHPTPGVNLCGPQGQAAGKGLAWSVSSWGVRAFRGSAVAEEEPKEVVEVELRFSFCHFPCCGHGLGSAHLSFSFCKMG